jgi:hypothetical protein
MMRELPAQHRRNDGSVGELGRHVYYVAIDQLLDQSRAGEANVPLADVFGGRPQITEAEQVGRRLRRHGHRLSPDDAVTGRRFDRVDEGFLGLEARMLIVARMGRRPVDLRLSRELIGEHRAIEVHRVDLMTSNEFAIGHTARMLDREREQRRIRCAQRDLRAALETERFSANKIQKLRRLILLRVVEAGSVISNAGAVLHELQDRDALPRGRQAWHMS